MGSSVYLADGLHQRVADCDRNVRTREAAKRSGETHDSIGNPPVGHGPQVAIVFLGELVWGVSHVELKDTSARLGVREGDVYTFLGACYIYELMIPEEQCQFLAGRELEEFAII